MSLESVLKQAISRNSALEKKQLWIRKQREDHGSKFSITLKATDGEIHTVTILPEGAVFTPNSVNRFEEDRWQNASSKEVQMLSRFCNGKDQAWRPDSFFSEQLKDSDLPWPVRPADILANTTLFNQILTAAEKNQKLLAKKRKKEAKKQKKKKKKKKKMEKKEKKKRNDKKHRRNKESMTDSDERHVEHRKRKSDAQASTLVSDFFQDDTNKQFNNDAEVGVIQQCNSAQVADGETLSATRFSGHRICRKMRRAKASKQQCKKPCISSGYKRTDSPPEEVGEGNVTDSDTSYSSRESLSGSSDGPDGHWR